MKTFNKRFNYLSHMVDSTADAVVRVGKVSAFWASMGSMAVFINLITYLGAREINITSLVIIQFLFWCSLYGILMITQLSWVAYIVYMAELDHEEDMAKEHPPTPLPTMTTKHYVLDKNQYRIDKVVDKFDGVGEEDGQFPF